QLLLPRPRLRCNQRQQRAAVRRRNGDPTLARLQAGVKGDIESELVHKEAQTEVLIPHINVDGVNTKVVRLGFGALRRPRERRDWRTAHCAIIGARQRRWFDGRPGTWPRATRAFFWRSTPQLPA